MHRVVVQCARMHRGTCVLLTTLLQSILHIQCRPRLEKAWSIRNFPRCHHMQFVSVITKPEKKAHVGRVHKYNLWRDKFLQHIEIRWPGSFRRPRKSYKSIFDEFIQRRSAYLINLPVEDDEPKAINAHRSSMTAPFTIKIFGIEALIGRILCTRIGIVSISLATPYIWTTRWSNKYEDSQLCYTSTTSSRTNWLLWRSDVIKWTWCPCGCSQSWNKAGSQTRIQCRSWNGDQGRDCPNNSTAPTDTLRWKRLYYREIFARIC